MLFPFMLASRFINSKNNNLKNELIINKWLNFLFEKILKLEATLINMGLRFPFGGTRFIVARKIIS